MQTLELNITDDREFFDVENNVNAAARSIYRLYAGLSFIEESKREKSLQIALGLFRAEGFARFGLHVIEQILVAVAAIALHVNRFDESLLGLGVDAWGSEKGADSDDCAQKDEQRGTTIVHKCYFPQRFYEDFRKLKLGKSKKRKTSGHARYCSVTFGFKLPERALPDT
jgi:hypothetical protein